MNLVLPARIEASLDPEEAKLDFAVGLYSSGKVSMGIAAEVAGTSVPALQQELGRRRIPINYNVSELEADLRSINASRG